MIARRWLEDPVLVLGSLGFGAVVGWSTPTPTRARTWLWLVAVTVLAGGTGALAHGLPVVVGVGVSAAVAVRSLVVVLLGRRIRASEGDRWV